MLEKTLESPLDFKEIQAVHSEGDQPWDFFGRNDTIQVSVFTWLQGSREGLLFPNLQLCVQPSVTEPLCTDIYVVICILSLSLLH